MSQDGHAGNGRSSQGMPPSSNSPRWWIYRGTGIPLAEDERDERWPAPPHWRDFHGSPDLPYPPQDDHEIERRLGVHGSDAYAEDAGQIDLVNAALYLRRPLLVTGRPGSGKSSLAYRITRELGLGRVLHWTITSRVTYRQGLYEYDAIGRAQARGPTWATADAGVRGDDPGRPAEAASAQAERAGGVMPPIGDFIHLGPLGTAFLPHRLPRVLLIDELDKSDIDLPNDLLNLFEDGEFRIPELIRVRNLFSEVVVHTDDPGATAPVRDGIVRCHAFPVVIITSNGEREFPPAFLRRCLRLQIPDPDEEKLAAMVAAHFPDTEGDRVRDLIRDFVDRREQVGSLAADQLLNSVHLVTSGAYRDADDASWQRLLDAIWQRLSEEP